MIDWKKRLRPGGSFLRGFIPRKRTEPGQETVSTRAEKIKIGLALGLTFITLLVLLTPDILLQGYKWNLGDVVPRPIVAPFSFSVENREETEKLRKAAEQAAPIIFQLNRNTDDRILQEVMSIFSTAQQISSRQDSSQPEKINILFEKIGFPISDNSAETLLRFPNYRQLHETVHHIATAIDTTYFLPDDAYAKAVSDANIHVWEEENNRSISLKDFSEQHGRIYSISEMQKQIEQITFKYLRQNEDRPVRVMVKEIFDHVLQPTLTLNSQRTEAARLEIREQIQPVLETIARGETIVPVFTAITPNQKRILDELSQNRLKYGFSIAFGRAVLLLIFGYFTALYLRRYYPKYSKEFQNIAPVCCLTVIVVGLTKLTLWLGGSEYLIPLASFAMLAGILFEIRFALLLTTELAVLLGVMLGLDLKHVLIFLASGTVAAFSVAHIIRRTDLVRAGILVSIINVIGISALFLFDHPLFSAYGGKWSEFISNIAAGAGNGMICYIITLGILPLFEWMFNLTTDVKLLEYTDPRGPLLQRLEKEAPGTYQHSLTVGQLAEAAADSIGVNTLLCRIGGYYQDIGKIVTPEYFTENHRTDEDRKKHDKLSPHMSCLVIKNHVKYGLELAKEYNLPPPVIDIIAQHHGTTLITYFFHKANELEEENGDPEEMNEEDFRYPGPKPQSAEAAIVMLADSVEAAVASIPNPTEGAIQQMVRKVVNDKFTDEQLDECDITLRDLHLITESLVQTLLSKYHRRVEYPETEIAEEKVANGNKA